MQSLFSKPWPVQRRLHVYALPDDPLRDEIVSYQSVMDGCDYCVPQPRAFLHATIQSYPLTLDQVEPESLEALQARLSELAARTAPFTLQMTGPYLNGRGITADAEPTDDWRRLVDGVRHAASESICTEDDLAKRPFGPHISVGYGRADGPSDVLEKALVDLGRTMDTPFRVERIHLLAVNQHVAAGTFDWEPVADYALG